MRHFSFFFVLTVFTVTSCSNPTKHEKQKSVINIFFLENEEQTFTNVNDKALSEIEIEDTPWISSDEIIMYDWSSHLIYLTEEKSFEQSGIPVSGKPFIVIANGKRCYIGALWPHYSSLWLQCPKIMVAPRYFPDDIVQISFNEFEVYTQENTDVRNNLYVKNALIQSAKIHYGLRCILNDVKVHNSDSNAEVTYTFTIYNDDKDDLYVLDPQRMGANLFHYFTNGVYFKTENKLYYSENPMIMEPEPYNHWEVDWHTKIKSGDSISRTLKLDGFRRIQPGEYESGFIFPSIQNVNKNDRIILDGRIWLGRIHSSSFFINVL